MKLTDKLRELTELQTKLRSETCVPWADRDRAFRDACTLTGFAALLAAAERLEAKNRRLRDLVREAYAEGFSDCPVYGDVDEDLAWSKSSAKAALDVMDKEGTDEAR